MKQVAVGFAVFLLLFVAWRHASPQGILFYQGVVLAVVVSAGQFLLTLFGRRGWRIAAKDSLLGFLLIYSFVFTVPTTVDRAYSVRLLAELKRSPEGMTQQQIEHWFADEFVAQGGVERRLREQASTGSVVETQGRYRLTAFGSALASLFGALQTVFVCEPPAR